MKIEDIDLFVFGSDQEVDFLRRLDLDGVNWSGFHEKVTLHVGVGTDRYIQPKVNVFEANKVKIGFVQSSLDNVDTDEYIREKLGKTTIAVNQFPSVFKTFRKKTLEDKYTEKYGSQLDFELFEFYFNHCGESIYMVFNPKSLFRRKIKHMPHLDTVEKIVRLIEDLTGEELKKR